jgi:signal transduction histidine kinase
MSGSIKFRLVAFVLAIALMVTLIIGAAVTAWYRSSDFRQKLASAQLMSFQIADHFQQNILTLNNLVLSYGVSRDTNNWDRFHEDSQRLNLWIDQQNLILPTGEERQILHQIDSAYDDYLAAADQIHNRLTSEPQPVLRLSELADFERQSERILNLAFQLALTHQESTDQLLTRSNTSIIYLRVLLLGSLLLLLLAGGGLAAFVYREMIAPLQVKLVASQQQVERQEKLAALGMLAAGVAHEIRNPLTALKAWLFIQRKHLEPGTPESEDAQIIADEISRLERIVHDFLLFARPSEPHLQLVPAEQPLREVQTLLNPQLEKAGIRLELDGCPSAHVRIDAGQIKQVLINLVQNAADSIGHSGTVTLRARLDSKRLSDRPTEVVILEVADTGKGIPPEIEKRLFDPFFTTKEAGTGLGLSIAARIVEKHGGALQYQTRLNHGTTFGIVLPRA